MRREPVLKLKDKSVLEKVQLGKMVVIAMDENVATFPTPNPPLSDVQEAALTLEAAEQTYKEKPGEVQKIARDNAEADLDDKLTNLRGYVDSIAQGRAEIIALSGMEVSRDPTSHTMTPPQDLRITFTENEGELQLKWKSVDGAKSYLVQQCNDPLNTNTWQHAAVSTKTSYLLTGLTSTDRMWIRVAAIGASGQGGWSDPAVKTVP